MLAEYSNVYLPYVSLMGRLFTIQYAILIWMAIKEFGNQEFGSLSMQW